MSIVTEITRINTNIANSYTAVDNKGGTLPETQNSANLATAINSIEVIEQATAEGESLSLTNTKAIPYSDYVVKGKSEQATRSGKNLFKNIPFTSTQRGLTITNDGNSIKVTGTAVSEYYSSIIFYADGSYENYEWWAADGKINPTKGYFNSNQAKNVLSVISNNATTEPWFRLLIGRETQVEATNVNFGETSTTILNENTEKINFIALGFLPDKTYNTEFKIQIEQGSTATSYEPYGASPSPDYPSEIHSVADDVNLFDKETELITYGYISSYEYSNGIYTIIPTGTGNPQIRLKFILPAGTYTLNSEAYLSIATILRNNNGLLNNFQAEYQNQTFTTTETSTELVFNWANPNNTNPITLDLRTLKIQKGTKATPYSPYNQGTVTIKQEDVKNYLDWNKFIDYSNWIDAESAGYKSFEISGLDTNKIYTLCRVDTAGYGEELKFAGFRNYKDNGNIFLHSTNNSQNLRNISSFPTEDGKIYINMFMNSQNDLNDYITIIKKCWVIEGTEYQEYVNNNYTIQTEPLRSLPNGVKDTIEEDGIHRRVGRVVLDGSENNWGTVGDNRYYLPIQDKRSLTTSVPCNIVSNYFTASNNAGDNISIGYMTEGYYTTGNKNIFFNYNGSNNDLAGFKTWLSNNPTEVIYELEEEIIEPLTQNQATTMLDIIKTGSYEGTTNIYTDEDVKPTIGVGYYKKS